MILSIGEERLLHLVLTRRQIKITGAMSIESLSMLTTWTDHLTQLQKSATISCTTTKTTTITTPKPTTKTSEQR